MNDGRDKSLVRPARSLRGFSLIELMIVIALMAIAAGVLIPRSDPTVTEQLRAVAQVVAADLGYARNLAVVNNSTYRVTFDLTDHQSLLQHTGSNTALNTLPKSPYDHAPEAADRHVTRLKQLGGTGPRVRLTRVEELSSPAKSVQTVTFTPLGGTARAAATRIWLECGAAGDIRYLPVSIDPATGLAEIGSLQATAPIGDSGEEP